MINVINDNSESEYSKYGMSPIGAFSRAESRPTLENTILPSLDNQHQKLT